MTRACCLPVTRRVTLPAVPSSSTNEPQAGRLNDKGTANVERVPDISEFVPVLFLFFSFGTNSGNLFCALFSEFKLQPDQLAPNCSSPVELMKQLPSKS